MTVKASKGVRLTGLLCALVLVVASLGGCADSAPPTNTSQSQSQSQSPASSGEPAATPGDSQSESPEAGETQLTGEIEVGVLPAEGTSAYESLVALADRMKEVHPDIGIEYTFANSKARPFMEQRWRAGDAPDIDYFVFNAQVPSTHEFVEKLLDLTPHLAQDGWGDTFLDSAKTVTSLDGGIYGVITDTHVISLFYNKKLFDQYEIAPPETWDQLMEAGRKLKENNVAPIAVTGMYQPYMGFWIDYLMQREVGYNEAKEAVLSGTLKDNPGFLSAAQKVEQMASEGFFINGFEGTDFTAAQIQFFQGNAGMIMMGTWLSSEMKDSIPADFELGVVSFPTVEGGKGNPQGTLSHSNIMAVNKETENLDLVLAFLKEITSVKEQTFRSQELRLISAVKDVPAPQGIHGLDEVVQNATELYVRYFGLEYEPDKFNAYYNEVAKLFFGQYTAEQFIEAADTAMGNLQG